MNYIKDFILNFPYSIDPLGFLGVLLSGAITLWLAKRELATTTL